MNHKRIFTTIEKNDGPADLFLLPLSNIAFQQLTALAEGLSNVQASTENDVWSYIWGTPFFSSSKAYTHLTGHRMIHAAFKWLWNSTCQNKHRFFFSGFCRKIVLAQELYLKDVT